MELESAVDRWLGQLEHALSAADDGPLRALFHPDAYWRDALALTWRIQTLSGRDGVLAALRKHAKEARAASFSRDQSRTAPREVKRAGNAAIEAFFKFETHEGRGNGVVRLCGEGADQKAWTLFTALDELKDHGERVGRARPTGLSYSREFRGPNWADLRKSDAAFKDRDPAVLIVGGGHAGLTIAARLKQLQVDALVVDRWPRVGDNWRRRYHALTLHNQVQVNHLPYLPFPPSWPSYIPKDKIAGWFEAYVEAMEINYWTGFEFEGGSYDESSGRWSITLRAADGARRDMHPRHVVLATGVSGIPNLPEIPSLGEFRGLAVHSSRYDDGEGWAGKRALVIGTGNSGHDIAQDLHSSGAQVTLVQRSPTHIVNLEPSAQLPYALYDEGPPLEDCDLITASMPFALARKSHIALTARAKEIDRELLDSLARVGFKLDYGDDGSGWQFKYLTRGGGYYFNVGCSDLIASGAIRLLPFGNIERFVAGGARLRGGELVPADLVVFATGYKGQQALVGKLFGDAVAERVGPVWGFSEGEELRNMFVRTAQPGLWFSAGSFAQCRIYSRYLGLQIKACEEGLLPLSV